MRLAPLLALLACVGKAPSDDTSSTTADADTDADSDADADADADTDTDTDADTDTRTDGIADAEIHLTNSSLADWVTVIQHDVYGGANFEPLNGDTLTPGNTRVFYVEPDTSWETIVADAEGNCAITSRYALDPDEEYPVEFDLLPDTWDGIDCF